MIMITAVAAIGLQVISPYHAVTISKNSTQFSQRVLHRIIQQAEKHGSYSTSEFFTFEKPAIECVSDNIFQSAKKLYKDEVVNAVSESAMQYHEDCLKLAMSIMLHSPESATRCNTM